VLWHFFFESLAYIVAFRLYLWQRQKTGDFLEGGARWKVIVAAVAGAAIGSKLLYWLEDPLLTAQRWTDVRYILGGKTIVGALAGGTLAVELTKLRAGIQRRTGDLFAVPLAVGIAIGRIGCFIAGKQDDTYGIATSLHWGVDLADGVRRHPVQLYEAGAMLRGRLLHHPTRHDVPEIASVPTTAACGDHSGRQRPAARQSHSGRRATHQGRRRIASLVGKV